jgi:hypothetical protein
MFLIHIAVTRFQMACSCAASENITEQHVLNHVSRGFSSTVFVTGIQSVSK